MQVVRTEKPWGYELLWARTDNYAGKILHVRSGQALSLHFHRIKDETQHVLSGRIVLTLEVSDGVETRDMSAGESCHIPAGCRHRIFALETATVLEASTSELDDIVRIEDNYGRVEALTEPSGS